MDSSKGGRYGRQDGRWDAGLGNEGRERKIVTREKGKIQE